MTPLFGVRRHHTTSRKCVLDSSFAGSRLHQHADRSILTNPFGLAGTGDTVPSSKFGDKETLPQVWTTRPSFTRSRLAWQTCSLSDWRVDEFILCSLGAFANAVGFGCRNQDNRRMPNAFVERCELQSVACGKVSQVVIGHLL